MVNKEEIQNEMLSFLSIAYKINRLIGQQEDADYFFALSSTQVSVLIILRTQGTMNMTELSSQMLVTKPQLTKIIDALVGMGLVTRGADPGNRRVVLVELSERGGQCIEDIIFGEDSFLYRCLHSVGEAKIDTLREAVNTIRDIFSNIEFV